MFGRTSTTPKRLSSAVLYVLPKQPFNSRTTPCRIPTFGRRISNMSTDFTYRGQHMKRWVPMFALTLLGLLLLFVAIGAIRSTPPQGYESDGQYYQPSHGGFYYWVTRSQPTYHVYVPPYGYSNTYRPWYSTDDTRYYLPTYHPPVRQRWFTSTQPTTRPSATGGFTRTPTPNTSTPYRSTTPSAAGGFTRTPTPTYRSPSSSGGFSRSPSTSRPTSRPSSSGGFHR